MVNRYIELQAQQILAYGGSIDKYMGDAVLVIFEGEGAAQRSLACARDILNEVCALNERLNESIQIGIGLSLGSVVMGNMGCDTRMEHTVIGPTVNLAARLCSTARGGELVVQEKLVQGVQESEPELYKALSHREEISVKGFSSAISVRRASQKVLSKTSTYGT